MFALVLTFAGPYIIFSVRQALTCLFSLLIQTTSYSSIYPSSLYISVAPCHFFPSVPSSSHSQPHLQPSVASFALVSSFISLLSCPLWRPLSFFFQFSPAFLFLFFLHLFAILLFFCLSPSGAAFLSFTCCPFYFPPLKNTLFHSIKWRPLATHCQAILFLILTTVYYLVKTNNTLLPRWHWIPRRRTCAVFN